MENVVCSSNMTQFYNNFSTQELQEQTSGWQMTATNESYILKNMFPTPSPSASSMSGPFSPGQFEEVNVPCGSPGRPSLKILEQPVSKFRFRYRSEMQGAHGSLLGRGETSRKKTHPTVELVNYCGEEDIVIRCLLYTSTDPPIPHMHQLISKEGSKEICDHEIVVSERNGYRAEFKGLGIVHLSKKDLKKELVRKKEQMWLEELRRDRDLDHLNDETLKEALKKKLPQLEKDAAKEAGSMDPNKVRLCFQAYYRGSLGQVNYVCEDVYSETIENSKSAETGELKICRRDRCAGSCEGGQEVYILVEKVCKKNIKVRFFEVDDQGHEVWSDYGCFNDHDVHHQYAIVFRTPPYRDTQIQDNVSVMMELVRPKDNSRSESMKFTYLPSSNRNRKRRCTSSSRSDSYNSSFEAPRSVRPLAGLVTGDDPMLSGSDSSRNGSWNFSSDALKKVIEDIGTDSESMSMLDDFAKFINSGEFQGYSQALPADRSTWNSPESNSSPTHNIQATDLELFGELSIQPGWTTDSASPSPSTKKKYFEKDAVVTDGCVQKEPPANRPPPKHDNYKEQTLNSAKNAYSKLLKLMKSRHANRQQEMKNIIKAEDHEFGPLHAAVLHGQLKELSDLLSLIIKSNHLNLINSTNRNKKTPVMVAVEESSVDCLKLLCMARADLNLVDHKGNTALHLAAMTKHNKCLSVLLTAQSVKEPSTNLEINKMNEKGETALHIAVRQKDYASVKLLVNAKADLNEKTGTAGQTPLHLAVEYDSEQIVELLLSQEGIKLEEVNFNNKTAEDLVNPRQKGIIALFQKATCTDDERENKMVRKISDDEDDDEEEEEDEDDDDDEPSMVIEESGEVDSDPEDGMVSSITHEDTQAAFGLDKVTVDILVENLDKNNKWKTACQKLNCTFLVGQLTGVASPTKCLLNFLAIDGKISLKDLRDVVKQLNVPNAVKVLDTAIAKRDY